MFALWKKNRELDRVTRLHSKAIKKAIKEKKSSEEIEALRSEMFADIDPIDEEIKALVSGKLIRKAESLFLPIPSLSESGIWRHGEFVGHWYLSSSGITKVRGLIREETAARRKAFLEWASPLTGIIAATTGLLAVIFAMT
ncbi:MAG: hypothetical protein A2Z76_04615 [Chloroflexi bacterium RBG_13_56_8b]|nr:MAG: hypothetical protein A2Z76_04615 [Chloroflexi bacterium RBG_13_56_8b]